MINKPLVARMLAAVLLLEALFMVPSLVISLLYGEGDAMALVWSILALLLVGGVLRAVIRVKDNNLSARDGMVIASLTWVVLSAFGALPFVFSGVIPNYIDAFFEAVSGFTTTGASIMTQIDGQPHGIMFWRSFTHWVGGMGVLVLFLSLMPKLSGRTSHLMRAESPGPTLSKILPKMGDTAKMLYIIYAVLTVLEFIILIGCGMNAYDAAIHAMGTAGTGGFSNYGASVAAFNSPAIEWVITVFMVLFGVNFALFFQAITGGWKNVLHNEELRWYLGFFFVSVLIIAIQILPLYSGFGEAVRYSGFQVATIMSTTGYATTDFTAWPVNAQMLLFLLMFVGSCAGSTCGGLKIVRVALVLKQMWREILHAIHPRKVKRISFERSGVEEGLLHSVSVYTVLYIVLVLVGAVLIGLENKYDVLCNLTASLTCVSNVGPGLSPVIGPAGGFAGYGPFAKVVMSFLMLAGRLELFPMLIFLMPTIWKNV